MFPFITSQGAQWIPGKSTRGRSEPIIRLHSALPSSEPKTTPTEESSGAAAGNPKDGALLDALPVRENISITTLVREVPCELAMHSYIRCSE